MAEEVGIMDASMPLLALEAVNLISECVTVSTVEIMDVARLSEIWIARAALAPQ